MRIFNSFILVITSVLPGMAYDWFTNPANGHKYAELSQNQYWDVVENEAVALGGHLVTINDAAENSWVRTTFHLSAGLSQWCWIGLSEDQPWDQTERHWSWSSGALLIYTNWGAGEPSSSAEHYVAMDGDGWWRDLSNPWGSIYRHTAVVEVVPEPSTLLGIGFAATVLTLRRKR